MRGRSSATTGWVAWTAHGAFTYIDIAQWVNDADKTNPIDVEGTASFYKDIRDTPQEWTIEHNYANGVKLIHMDMVSARKRAPEFMSMPSNGASVFYGTEGWIYVSRQGIITKPASLASEKIGPNQIQVIRSNDHRRNLLNAIRTGQPTICGVEGAVRAQCVIQQEYISLCLGRKLRWDPVARSLSATRKRTAGCRGPCGVPGISELER